MGRYVCTQPGGCSQGGKISGAYVLSVKLEQHLEVTWYAWRRLLEGIMLHVFLLPLSRDRFQFSKYRKIKTKIMSLVNHNAARLAQLDERRSLERG